MTRIENMTDAQGCTRGQVLVHICFTDFISKRCLPYSERSHILSNSQRKKVIRNERQIYVFFTISDNLWFIFVAHSCIPLVASVL